MCPEADGARPALATSRRWVVKIGSSLLTADGRGLDRAAIATWVAQIGVLRDKGVEVVLVSSGSVAEGMARLGWDRRPQDIHWLQAAAAVGQMGLVQSWESAFQAIGCQTAQVLLVHDDLSNRRRYLNARTTLRSLMRVGVVPVINENDTVATEELRFGDNDTLAGLVANLVEADLLVILTDQDGLFSADPRRDTAAELLSEASVEDERLDAMAAGSRGTLGRGGMTTKLRAARLAARSGSHTVIAGGRQRDVLTRIGSGEAVGTWLRAEAAPVTARKQWLAGHLTTRGRLQLDDGAVRVLRESGGSLLPVGVRAVAGDFSRGDVVVCVDAAGLEVARGLVNYASEEASRIAGQPSSAIASILGYRDEEELIHRDNLVLL